jgi:recombination protein RecR
MQPYAESLEKLINELKKLPGIGPKSAQRIAFHLLRLGSGDVQSLASALTDAKEKIKSCSVCFNYTDQDPCRICADTHRDNKVIAVVSEPKDLMALERTGFRGRYHVLGGVLSPLDGIGPDNLRIKELLGRLKEGVEEVVVATNPTTEGEATALYLTKLLAPLMVKVTRLAYGLPIGADLDFADEATLSRALEGRTALKG